MDIYDPIGNALGLEPVLFEFNPPKSSDPIPAWNKGINQFGCKENHFLYGKHQSEETKAKITAKALGRKASAETKAKMSEIKKGKPANCSMLGKTHSEETKDKMSQSAHGFSAVARQKQREHMLGKKLSEETRAKMRLAALNRKNKIQVNNTLLDT